MLLTTAAPEALSLAPIFCPRMEKGRTGESSVRDEDTMAALCLGVEISVELPPLDFHVPTQGVQVLSRGPKNASLGPGLARLESLEPHSARGLHLPSVPSGAGVGEAAEVLAFLVMCLIYLLALGLGSLKPVQQVDCSDHVPSSSRVEGGQVA